MKIERYRDDDGKAPVNQYYICNVDEHYSNDVKNVIEQGEYYKRHCDLSNDTVDIIIVDFMKYYEWVQDPYIIKMYEHLIHLFTYYILYVDVKELFDSDNKMSAMLKFVNLNKDDIFCRLDSISYNFDDIMKNRLCSVKCIPDKYFHELMINFAEYIDVRLCK